MVHKGKPSPARVRHLHVYFSERAKNGTTVHVYFNPAHCNKEFAMRSLILSLVLGAASLGLVVGTPSSAKAQFRRSFAYYPTYSYGYPAYSYGYPAYSYGYPSYYYSYPSYSYGYSY